jgi:hypothetical protein
MTNRFLIVALTLVACQATAQNDTLLFENFDVDSTANYAAFNSGNDLTWVNFDADGIPDYNSRPQNWFYQPGTFADVDSNDASIWSSSWLANFQPGNRNWLITPPLTIVDASAVLSWASTPRQTPRYLDGYTVMVSTTDNLEASFTDTLFQAAQYISGSGSDWTTYVFSNGFVHGWDSTYIQFDGDSGAYIGELRPFSASLAAYSGQSIYIAFLHDSDDDNLLAIDDILVTGTLVGLSEVADATELTIFPNPARDKVELTYHLEKTGVVTTEIYDVKGSLVGTFNRGVQIAGLQKLTIDVSELASGTYAIVLRSGESLMQSRFVRE